MPLDAVGFDLGVSAQRKSGYAAVDALVALAILAATTIFALSAVHQGLKAAKRALEIAQAGEHLKLLLEESKVTKAATSGAARTFSWNVTIGRPVVTANAAEMCVHKAVLTALDGGRRYEALTAQICPAAAAP